MKNSVSVTRLKNGGKMYHVDVPDDITAEELKKLMNDAALKEQQDVNNNMPPYERSHPIDENKIYNFSMTGTALIDMMDIVNGKTPNRKYGKIRIFDDRLIFSAATFLDNGEVIPSPHAIVAKFTVTEE